MSKIKLLNEENYLSMIHASVGTKLFQHIFARVNGKKKDITEDGIFSCALFVSSILTLFGQIDAVHATVTGTEKAMIAHGWKKVKAPKPGDVLIWESVQEHGEEHLHIGFYIGNEKAISNSSIKKFPIKHHWTFGVKKGNPKRRVIAIYRTKLK